MKKRGLFNKFLFIINSLCAVLLLMGYLLPYISPNQFPRLSVLSLVLPVLIGINFGFVVYWVVSFKRQFLLSVLVLLLGIHHITGLYNFGKSDQPVLEDISVMSYNVRAFGIEGIKNKKDVQARIYAFIKEVNPDILCLQEYSELKKALSLKYPHQAKAMKPYKTSFGQVIYSRYPIINSGSLDFKKTSNNIMYADVVIHNDTVRVYNIHLQSLRVSADFDKWQPENSKRLLGRISSAFKQQEQQVKAFLENETQCSFPVIVAGDFNNSSTSYIYRKIKGEKVDAFAKAGTGTGRTFTFDFLPLRIDFVLIDPIFEPTVFKNYDIGLSDHEPILASFKLPE